MAGSGVGEGGRLTYDHLNSDGPPLHFEADAATITQDVMYTDPGAVRPAPIHGRRWKIR